MRKVLSLMTALLLSSSAFAADYGIGVNVGVATKSEMSTGMIGAKALIGLPLSLTLAPSVNYWFPKDWRDGAHNSELKTWDLNADLHWNILNLGIVKAYPFVGLNYIHVSASATDGWNDIDLGDAGQLGLNAGIGAQVRILPFLGASVEGKALVSDGITQFIPTASLYFMF